MARAADAKIGKGEVGPLAGIPLGIKDLFATEGVRTTACSKILGDFIPPYEFDGDVAALARRRGDARQAQQRRVRDGLVERDVVLRSGGESLAAHRLECRCRRGRGDRRHASGAGRLVRRLGRGGCGQPLPWRDRNRHRRIDPPARVVHRHRRHQADLRPLLALGHRRLCVLARSGRAVGEDGARCGDPDALDVGARSEGYDLGGSAGAGLRGRDRQIGQGHEDRHSEGISPRRHARRDRAAVGEGQGMAAGGRRRDGRGVAAAHEICAAGLLHRRAGGSLLQPRALRRRALRPAQPRPQHRRDVREHARGRVRRGGAPAHHDRHLRAVGRLLRRLLPARAKGAHPDQEGFRGLLCEGRATRS